jgi:hypothetical protein
MTITSSTRTNDIEVMNEKPDVSSRDTLRTKKSIFLEDGKSRIPKK